MREEREQGAKEELVRKRDKEVGRCGDAHKGSVSAAGHRRVITESPENVARFIKSQTCTVVRPTVLIIQAEEKRCRIANRG